MLRRLLVTTGATEMLAAAPVSAAFATSGAHFFKDTGATVADSGALAVTIDEAGVGNATVNYTVAWTATADYGCINGGGNHPQASNKQTRTAGGSSSFSESPINGRVRATVNVDGTPPAATGFSCPGGQTLVLADVSYKATLSDTTNGVSTDVSASRVFFTFGKK